MANALSLGKTASQAKQPQGFYFATVCRVHETSTVKHATDAVVGAGETMRSQSVDAVVGKAPANPATKVYVKVPRLTEDLECGPIRVFGTTPDIGDTILVGFLEGRKEELVALIP